MQDLRPTAIYVRVSGEKQAADDRYSIPEQLDRLRKYCEAQGWKVAREYVDPGHSGSNINRPAMQDMVTDIKAGRIKRVVVLKLDRLSRSQRDTMFLIEDVFKKNDVAFVSLSEMFDTSTPFGIAMIGILSVFAQLERENIKDRMSMGRLGRAKRGLWRGGSNVPTGYRFEDGQLVVDEYEAAQVREIFRLFLAGKAYHAIGLYMQSRYTTKHGNYTGAGVIPKMLANPLYIGKIKYGDQVFDGQHEPIIDMDTWNRAQARLEMLNQKMPYHLKYPFRGNHLLSGLLWCGNCGARYCCRSNKNKYGQSYSYYVCYTREKIKGMSRAEVCKNPRWREEKLDAAVLEEVRHLCSDPEYFAAAAASKHSEDTTGRLLDDCEKKLADLEKQINRLIDLYQMGIDADNISQRLRAAQDAKIKLENEITLLKEKSPRNAVSGALGAIQELSGCLDDPADKEGHRRLVEALVNKIVVTEDGFEIDWKL